MLELMVMVASHGGGDVGPHADNDRFLAPSSATAGSDGGLQRKAERSKHGTNNTQETRGPRLEPGFELEPSVEFRAQRLRMREDGNSVAVWRCSGRLTAWRAMWRCGVAAGGVLGGMAV